MIAAKTMRLRNPAITLLNLLWKFVMLTIDCYLRIQSGPPLGGPLALATKRGSKRAIATACEVSSSVDDRQRQKRCNRDDTVLVMSLFPTGFPARLENPHRMRQPS